MNTTTLDNSPISPTVDQPSYTAAVRRWDRLCITQAVLVIDGRPLTLWSGPRTQDIEFHLTAILAELLDGRGAETRLRVAAGVRSLWAAATRHQPVYTSGCYRQAVEGISPDLIGGDPRLIRLMHEGDPPPAEHDAAERWDGQG